MSRQSVFLFQAKQEKNITKALALNVVKVSFFTDYFWGIKLRFTMVYSGILCRVLSLVTPGCGLKCVRKSLTNIWTKTFLVALKFMWNHVHSLRLHYFDSKVGVCWNSFWHFLFLLVNETFFCWISLQIMSYWNFFLAGILRSKY